MSTPMEGKTPFGKRFLRGLGWFVRFLLRLLVVIIVGAALGFVVYLVAVYGVQLFDSQLLQPIRENTQRLNDLEAYRMSDLEASDQRILALQKQVDTLITQGDSHRESLDSMDSRIEDAEDGVDDALLAIQDMQSDMDKVTETLDQVPPRIDDLDDAMADVDDAVVDVEKIVDDLQLSLADIQDSLAVLAEKVEDDAAVKVLRNDVMLLKVMEALTRARLFLFQENTGLAEDELVSARDVLLILKGMVPDFQKDAVQAILDRLDLARENLTTVPNVAEDDLEAAWQLLLIGLPVTASEGTTLTVSPTATLTSTGTLTVTPSITSTVLLTETTVITP